MNYRESLEFLYGLRQAGIKLGLRNIALLLNDLGHPQKRFLSIHVAGTNGKGSTASCLAAILSAAGYRTGLYTSPHLQRFNERIRIDGVPVGDGELAALITEVKERGQGRGATFFEFTTAVALLCFERRRVDFAVIETGMGGRLDATVLISPLVSLITPVSFDHCNYLGDTLARIGAEKGGIIKQRTPVVIGPQEPPVRSVLLARAVAKEAPVYLWERDFEAVSTGGGCSYRGLRTALDDLHPALLGRHQHANLALSLCAAELVREACYPVPDAALRKGVETVCWPGRLEWWRGLPRVLLDGAHNGAGARVLGNYLEAEGIDGIHWVLGIKWDKDAGGILAPILPRCRALYCTVAREETFIDPHHLAAEGSRNGIASEVFADPETALRRAMQRRRAGETILVAGSLFIVGAVREVLERMELMS